MSKTKKQTIYFYRLLLKENKSATTLEKILEQYINNNKNKTFSIKKNEKEIWIDTNFDLNKDFLFFRYEVSNFGTRESIKDRISKKEVGYLDENQYLEKFQCVVLNLKSFFEKIKNNNTNELKNVDLVSLVFYQIDFINKLNKIKNFKKMTIDGKVSNSPEFNYANIQTNDNEIDIKTHHIDIIKTKFNKPYFIPVTTLKKLLEDQFKKYDNVKIILEGEGEQNKNLKLLSDDIQITTKIEIEKLEGNKLNYSDLKKKMIESFKFLDDMNAIAIENK